MQPKIQTAATLLTHSQPLIDNANNLTEQAERALVTNEDDFASATDFVKTCTNQFDLAETARKAITGPLNNHVKWINDQFRPITTALDAAKRKVSGKAAAWRVQEDKRIAEEEERQRKEAEEQALKDAAVAAEAGDDERAEAILEVAAETPQAPTRAAPVRGKVTGATGSTRTTWTGEVKYEDIKDVCQAIANGSLPMELIKDWNKTAMNAVAKRVEEEGKYQGLTITKNVGLSVR